MLEPDVPVPVVPVWPAPVDEEPLSFCIEPVVFCDPVVPVFVFV
jgi:hypothetical protein